MADEQAAASSADGLNECVGVPCALPYVCRYYIHSEIIWKLDAEIKEQRLLAVREDVWPMSEAFHPQFAEERKS